MNTTAIRPQRSRILGWYAVRWAHITDWYRAYNGRFRRFGHSRTYGSPADFSQTAMPPDAAFQAQNAKPSPQIHPETVREKEASPEEKKLKAMANESHTILIQARSVFPFTPFPTTITIDRHKLTIVYKRFFAVEQTVSVPLETIKNIQADFGPFLGSLIITSDLFINNTQKIDYLHRRDVRKIQKLVQGAMVAIKEHIDINKVETHKLRPLLSDLGAGHSSVLSS